MEASRITKLIRKFSLFFSDAYGLTAMRHRAFEKAFEKFCMYISTGERNASFVSTFLKDL